MVRKISSVSDLSTTYTSFECTLRGGLKYFQNIQTTLGPFKPPSSNDKKEKTWFMNMCNPIIISNLKCLPIFVKYLTLPWLRLWWPQLYFWKSSASELTVCTRTCHYHQKSFGGKIHQNHQEKFSYKQQGWILPHCLMWQHKHCPLSLYLERQVQLL